MTNRPRGTIAVAGAVAAKPHHGGHTWVYLQYLLGLQRLGWDVLFLDWVGPEAPPEQRRFVRKLMARFDVPYCLLIGEQDGVEGQSRIEVCQSLRRSAFLLNVMGYLRDEELLAAAPRRVFLDIDPGFGQMWKVLGLADLFAGHDDFVTIGENIGQPNCLVPTCGLKWITTPQPVVLEKWPASSGRHTNPMTSVASWRGAYGPVEYEGRQYGLRAHEFRKFVALPQRCPFSCALALDIHPDDAKDRALLEQHGWQLIEPTQVAAGLLAYQDFIRSSAAEFMVAKGMYVQSRCGWLSDRSLCYLATGRPVLAQDTGVKDRYPTNEGLVTFETLDEAVVAAQEVHDNYARHAKAARTIAEQHFDSDRVLGRMLARLGVM